MWYKFSHLTRLVFVCGSANETVLADIPVEPFVEWRIGIDFEAESSGLMGNLLFDIFNLC